MPIKTTFLVDGSSDRAMRTCSTISPRLRSPRSPIVPVAQNEQAIAQPTCDDTQQVTRVDRSVAWRMTTASTSAPSRSSTTTFVVVPSLESWRDATRVLRTENASSRNAGSFWGTRRLSAPQFTSAQVVTSGWCARYVSSASPWRQSTSKFSSSRRSRSTSQTDGGRDALANLRRPPIIFTTVYRSLFFCCCSPTAQRVLLAQ